LLRGELEVSVVVATRNRASLLAKLLESLRAQTLDPARYEVIVVDDASDDGDTPALLEADQRRDGLELRVIRRPSGGSPGMARNDGWRAARGKLIAFTDDDCVATPGWLAAGIGMCTRHPGAIVQGRTDANPAELDREGPFSRTLRIQALGPYYQTCNIFYPRAVLEDLRGFDPPIRFGEDADLAWRAFDAGVEAVFAEDALVYHTVSRLGPVGKLRLAARWTEYMAPYARHPELRSLVFTKRYFWRPSHYLLVRALLALALPRRRHFLRQWLAGPYIRHLAFDRGPVEQGSRMLAPFYALHDLIEVWAVARAAVRYRSFML
jgi:glycosyltransferase involved in cell wall biosynthesis